MSASPSEKFHRQIYRSRVEIPCPIASNVAWCKNHFWSEGKPEQECAQARYLHLDIMNEGERKAVHKNTAVALKLVEFTGEIFQRYLGQQLAIDEGYARSIWEKLPDEPQSCSVEFGGGYCEDYGHRGKE